MFILENVMEKLKSIVHLLLLRKPVWRDTLPCGKMICRTCGGKFGRQNTAL